MPEARSPTGWSVLSLTDSCMRSRPTHLLARELHAQEAPRYYPSALGASIFLVHRLSPPLQQQHRPGPGLARVQSGSACTWGRDKLAPTLATASPVVASIQRVPSAPPSLDTSRVVDQQHPVSPHLDFELRARIPGSSWQYPAFPSII